jgi:predicted metalloprotease
MANWGKLRTSGNVEDRRSAAPFITGGLTLTGAVIYLLFNILTKGNINLPIDVANQVIVLPQDNTQKDQFEGADDYETFTSTVLGSNNSMWEDVFKQLNREYVPPKLVLFRTATESGCGVATSASGPHYCPADGTIYLDETFFDELTGKFQAKGGDVAEAYVIAHEVGHHAQNQLGIMDKTLADAQSFPDQANKLSINMELQADCFAGLWAYSIKHLGVLTPGEIEEAMDAAASVGDDRVQETITGYVNPETWTHGSSQQRVEAFTNGFSSGKITACENFPE